MEKKQGPEFSWANLFNVTTRCFWLFSGLIKLIIGSPTHVTLFFKTGIISLVLWFISLISKGITVKPSIKKEKILSFFI